MRLPSFHAMFAGTRQVVAARRVRTIYEIADLQRRLLLTKEQKAVMRMLGAWKLAEAKIQLRLDAMAEKIQQAAANGGTVSPAWLYQQERWNALLDAIDLEVAKYSNVATSATQAQQAASITMGLKHSRQLVRAAGVRAGFKSLPSAALENMVGFLSDQSPLSDLFTAMRPGALDAARVIFVDGMSQGKNPKVIARALKSELGDAIGDRSARIARTESLRAYRNAAQQNYGANSDVVMAGRWASSRDGRTCYLCLAKDGTLIPHGQKMAAHVGCRCSVVPVVRFLEVDRGTGEQWLESQSEAVQLAKLGPTRYELWKSGDASLQDLVTQKFHPRWGESVSSVPIKTVRENLDAGRRAAAPITTMEQLRAAGF